MGLREQILGTPDRPTKFIPVPEWGGIKVGIRTLAGTERDQFEADSYEKKKNGKRELNLKNVRARLVQLTVVDENNDPVFQPGDIDILGAKSAKALDRLFDVAQELNGFKDEDIEDMVKNSETEPNGDSTSV
jgi:hypothetical protein